MDRFISFTVEPADGTPYQKLVNTDSISTPIPRSSSFIWNGSGGDNWELAGELRVGGAPAGTEELSAYISKALLSYNGVSGAIQVMEPSPIFKITSFSTQS
jgi:hypothetical protein